MSCLGRTSLPRICFWRNQSSPFDGSCGSTLYPLLKNTSSWNILQPAATWVRRIVETVSFLLLCSILLKQVYCTLCSCSPWGALPWITRLNRGFSLNGWTGERRNMLGYLDMRFPQWKVSFWRYESTLAHRIAAFSLQANSCMVECVNRNYASEGQFQSSSIPMGNDAGGFQSC